MKRISGGFYGSGSFSKLLPHSPPDGNPMFLTKYWVSDEVGGAPGGGKCDFLSDRRNKKSTFFKQTITGKENGKWKMENGK
ncbi:MAG TPA: hypothetical protein PKD57_13810 [Saprospiraceae bacterium]|nr:hypothetical protein [Saprospiraceae bacterium]